MPKIIKIEPERIKHLFDLYKEGESLNQLGKISGISRQTLTRLFQKNFPLEFGTSKYGLDQIFKEYMRSNTLTAEEKNELAEWLEQNKEKIAASDKSSSTKLFTEAQLQARTISECGSKKDWRLNLISPSDFN